MFSNLQISRSLNRAGRGGGSDRTVSVEAMHAEWLEVQSAQHDPAMFRPLYDRYYEAVFRFLYNRSQDEELAADLCAQIFLKALQRLGDYTFQGVPFSAWLFRIASNELAQHYRQSQKVRVVSMEEGNLFDLADEIGEEDRSEEQRKSLLEAMQTLKAPDMALIEMRFFEQRSFREIAEILGITESNAKVKTYRILERLKAVMLKINPASND
jgi:RNA polymerase sigma-70 factor, ECF subfamily